MINFFTTDVVYKQNNKGRLREWLKRTIIENKRIVGEINYIFCSDDFLAEINKKYLNHDTYTDIITFDNSLGKEKKYIGGEIYISIERVKENAEKFSVSYEEEIKRVMVHGVFHLLGNSDKTPKQKKTMRKLENKAIKNYLFQNRI